MNITNNTVLISGGSAGIGFELAKLLSQNNNRVIITGRDKERLQNAAAQLKNVTAITCDVSNQKDVLHLVDKLNKDFLQLNIVINNAGRAIIYNFADENANAFEKAADEMLTNYLSVIRLNELLLPRLKKQKEAAIVNVSSVVAIVPGLLATYSASKAALHSYTQSLRISLEQASIKVFELMPPLVNTELSKEVGGANGIHPSVVAEGFLDAFEKDEYEIHIGDTADIYKLFLSSPAEALKAMNARRKSK
jgi:uncharacterized oxidoreductase